MTLLRMFTLNYMEEAHFIPALYVVLIFLFMADILHGYNFKHSHLMVFFKRY